MSAQKESNLPHRASPRYRRRSANHGDHDAPVPRLLCGNFRCYSWRERYLDEFGDNPVRRRRLAHMTLEEFYAQALLTTFPLAVRESPYTPEVSGKAKVVQVAHDYAAELTACFKRHRGIFTHE